MGTMPPWPPLLGISDTWREDIPESPGSGSGRWLHHFLALELGPGHLMPMLQPLRGGSAVTVTRVLRQLGHSVCWQQLCVVTALTTPAHTHTARVS